MAKVKHFTPYGIKSLHTNDAERDRRTLDPFDWKNKYSKDGWLRESELERGAFERVALDDNNRGALFYRDGKFIVSGYANGGGHTKIFNTLPPARDAFVHLVKEMYPE